MVPAIDQEQSNVIRDHRAARVFIARTTVMNADFRAGAKELLAIGEICRHLDGIPLAESILTRSRRGRWSTPLPVKFACRDMACRTATRES